MLSFNFRLSDNTCNGHRAGCVLGGWPGAELLVVKVGEAVQTAPVNQSDLRSVLFNQSEASVTRTIQKPLLDQSEASITS